MPKKRRQKQSQVSIPDARREVAARAAKALRSAETAKFRNDLINLYQQATSDEQTKIRTVHQRRMPPRQSVHATGNGRQLPSQSALRKSHLSAQVRDMLQDGIRLLACERRRTRKELMFAMRRAGKNSYRNKKAKWTANSYLRCK